MGVFYPPHLVLYGLLRRACLRRQPGRPHALGRPGGLLGGRGGSGSRPAGSALAGFALATSGFFVIHLPHQWGYTTGELDALGLGRWPGRLACRGGDGPRRGPGCWRAVLGAPGPARPLPARLHHPGGLALMAAWSLRRPPSRTPSGESTRRGGLACPGVLVAVFCRWRRCSSGRPLDWPGSRPRQRDYEYLSGFAATPFHLIKLRRSRPVPPVAALAAVAWDPFHTSPEERLAYVGLVAAVPGRPGDRPRGSAATRRAMPDAAASS